MRNTERFSEVDDMDIISDEDLHNDKKAKAGVDVRDPVKIKSSSALRGSKKCSLCSEKGHKKPKCPLNPLNVTNSSLASKRGRGGQTREHESSSRMRRGTTPPSNETESYHPMPLSPDMWFSELANEFPF